MKIKPANALKAYLFFERSVLLQVSYYHYLSDVFLFHLHFRLYRRWIMNQHHIFSVFVSIARLYITWPSSRLAAKLVKSRFRET